MITIILTPYENAEEFELVYLSQLLSSTERSSVFSHCIYIYEKYKVLDWYETHLSIIITSLFNDQYKIVMEEVSMTHIEELSPSPDSWVVEFVYRAIQALKRCVE